MEEAASCGGFSIDFSGSAVSSLSSWSHAILMVPGQLLNKQGMFTDAAALHPVLVHIDDFICGRDIDAAEVPPQP